MRSIFNHELPRLYTTNLIGMWRCDEQNRSSLRNTPGTSRHNFTEEHIDDVANGIQEHIVLPVHHRIELLLRGWVRRGLRRCRVLCPSMFRHYELALKSPALLEQARETIFRNRAVDGCWTIKISTELDKRVVVDVRGGGPQLWSECRLDGRAEI